MFNWMGKQEEVRRIAREFAEREIVPLVEELDRQTTPSFAFDLFHKMGAMGFMGYPLDSQYGGKNKSQLEYATLIEEIASYSASASLILAVNNLAYLPISLFGSEEQKLKYLPRMAKGELVGSFCLTEPNAGSDAKSQQTTAVLDGDHYRINGEKIFIMHGDVADIMVVFCKIDGKVSALIMDDTTVEGLERHALTHKMGIRGATTARIKFTNCPVPRENVLFDVGKGFRIALGTLDAARIGIAAQSLGIAQAALNRATEYAKTRQQFGQPIGKFQAISFSIAEVAIRVEAARLLTYKAAILQDEGKPFSTEAAMAKYYASETASYAADWAVQIHGGYGYIGELADVERIYRDARITRIYEGTNQIQLLVISRSILGF